MPQLPEERGKSGFTFRACVVAGLLAVVLAASSIYIALSLGAMPWPIIISVIPSGVLLKLLGSVFRPTNIHEMNVAQAGASIGGVLASAAAFTIPAMWLLASQGKHVEPLSTITVIIICITGGILGLLLSISIRRVFIDEENLPYASGRAGADVLIASDRLGGKAKIVLVWGALAGLFMALTYLGNFSVVSVPELASIGIVLVVALFIAPLAGGIGYILGPRISVWSWFGGSLVGWGILIPLLFLRGTEIGNAASMI
ncbi:MAG: OPT/YSL family transporter, partial [Candidatus Micrarchaeota archaeon]